MIQVRSATPRTVQTSQFQNNPAQVNQVAPSKGNAQIPMVDMPGEANYKPTLNAMSLTVNSASGGGASAITAYFLNEDAFNTTPTTNGSAPGSVTKTYGDGWSGAGYNRYAYLNSAENGIACYGLTLVYTVISSSAQDASALASANPTWLMANLVGNRQVPVGLVLAAGTRNTQYLQGTMTVRFRFNLGSLNQLSFSVPAGDSAALTIMTQPFDI